MLRLHIQDILSYYICSKAKRDKEWQKLEKFLEARKGEFIFDENDPEHQKMDKLFELFVRNRSRPYWRLVDCVTLWYWYPTIIKGLTIQTVTHRGQRFQELLTFEPKILSGAEQIQPD